MRRFTIHTIFVCIFECNLYRRNRRSRKTQNESACRTKKKNNLLQIKKKIITKMEPRGTSIGIIALTDVACPRITFHYEAQKDVPDLSEMQSGRVNPGAGKSWCAIIPKSAYHTHTHIIGPLSRTENIPTSNKNFKRTDSLKIRIEIILASKFETAKNL